MIKANINNYSLYAVNKLIDNLETDKNILYIPTSEIKKNYPTIKR